MSAALLPVLILGVEEPRRLGRQLPGRRRPVLRPRQSASRQGEAGGPQGRAPHERTSSENASYNRSQLSLKIHQHAELQNKRE